MRCASVAILLTVVAACPLWKTRVVHAVNLFPLRCRSETPPLVRTEQLICDSKSREQICTDFTNSSRTSCMNFRKRRTWDTVSAKAFLCARSTHLCWRSASYFFIFQVLRILSRSFQTTFMAFIRCLYRRISNSPHRASELASGSTSLQFFLATGQKQSNLQSWRLTWSNLVTSSWKYQKFSTS